MPLALLDSMRLGLLDSAARPHWCQNMLRWWALFVGMFPALY